MNRRLFFMFLTTLAKTPKWELRQVLPQINVVNAFKSSMKNKSKGNSSTAPTWKLNVTKKAEPETPTAPPIEIKVEEMCFKKKQDDAPKEDLQRRKRYEDDEDSDAEEEGKDMKVKIRGGRRDEGGRKERMYESCRNWATARGRIGNQHKWK